MGFIKMVNLPVSLSTSFCVTSYWVLQPSPSKVSRLKWKSMTLQKAGLVVKDVVCLPRGHYLAQLER